MLIDLQKTSYVKGLHTSYDVVIIGAGAAGITLAHKLKESGKRIALFEGGGEEYTDKSQDCYKGQSIGDPYFDLEHARLRFFGGTTNHWAGMCRSFEEIDFARSYLGEEYEWPISFNELDQYKREACQILEISDSFEDIQQNESNIKQIEFQFSPPVRFKEKYFEELKEAPNVTIFLNSTLVDIDGASGNVSTATFKSFNGNGVTVSGSKFVLAMGGIENSRYLLWIEQKNSNKLFVEGLPIGKFWMEHPHFTLGQAIVEKAKVPARFYSLIGSAQESFGIMNCGFRVDRLNDEGTKALIEDVLCIAPRLGQSLVNLAGRNLVCGVKFRAAWEQAPNVESSISLSSNLDSFGVPRPVLNWRKTQLDRYTVRRSVAEFNKWLLDIDGGRSQLTDWMLNDGEYPEDDELAGYHHMGGTRMHKSAALGVVDRNCKLFGSQNLYIAGSSVFTTGGHNNPTLPIVQFALRLADHLEV